jgi:chromosome segregation ATPase
MKDEELDSTAGATVPGEVDRIRDIIFGPQMRQYQQEFQALRKHLNQLERKLDQLADDGQTQKKKLATLRRDMRRMGDELRSELQSANQVERAHLGQVLLEIGSRLGAEGSSDRAVDLDREESGDEA